MVKGWPVPSPEFYPVVFTTAPILLLAVNPRVVFGPVPEKRRHRTGRGHGWSLATDVIAVVSVGIAAATSLLVMVGAISDSPTTRNVAAYGAGLALFMAMITVLAGVLQAYTDSAPGNERSGGELGAG
jgi:hypothetical protein